MKDLAGLLSSEEEAIVQPILDGRSEALSSSEFEVDKAGSILRCSVVPRGRNCCPFSFVFQQSEGDRRFSFFAGRGAMLVDWEVIESQRDIRDLAADVERFLRSKVVWIQAVRSGHVVRDVLEPSLYVVDGLQLGFANPTSPHSGCWPFPRHATTRKHVFDPWM